MTVYHVRRSNNAGLCGAPLGECSIEDELHFFNPKDATDAASERRKWKSDDTTKGSRQKRRSRAFRSKHPDDPWVIGSNYEPHPDSRIEEEHEEERYIPDTENPNMRHKDDFDKRYIAAQERSIRQSRLEDESLEDAKEYYGNSRSGLIEYHSVNDDGVEVRYKFSKRGLLHSMNHFAYEDYQHKVRYYQGIVHSDEDDGPALIKTDGSMKLYIRYGLLHRQNGPAVITPHEVEYWRHGLLHRDGAPAVLHSTGVKEWWEKGELLGVDVPWTPETPEDLQQDTKEWWNDPQAVAQAEYEKENYI